MRMRVAIKFTWIMCGTSPHVFLYSEKVIRVGRQNDALLPKLSPYNPLGSHV